MVPTVLKRTRRLHAVQQDIQTLELSLKEARQGSQDIAYELKAARPSR